MAEQKYMEPNFDMDTEVYLHPDPDIREYQLPQLTSNQYVKYLMRNGYKKMTRTEWKFWHDKKRKEEKWRSEYYFEMKYGR